MFKPKNFTKGTPNLTITKHGEHLYMLFIRKQNNIAFLIRLYDFGFI
jgi:hypothetical protein